MSFIQSSNQNDIIYFKEEILKELKKFEAKIKKTLDSHILLTQNKLEDNQSKITAMIEKVNSLSSQVSTNTSLKEKVDEIYAFKIKAQQDFMIQEINRESIAHDLKNAINKYDNILSNSIMYPGVIGAACKFSNFHDFIDFVVNNINQLNTAKEKNNVDFKNFKKKNDSSITSIKTQIELNNQDTKDNFRKVYLTYDEKIKKSDEEYQKSLVDIRIDNNKIVAELKAKADKLNESYKSMEKLKKDFEEKVNIEINKVIQIPEEVNKKFKSVQDDFDSIKIRFLELTDFVKSYKFVNKKKEKTQRIEKREKEKEEDTEEEKEEEDKKEEDKKILTAKKENKKKVNFKLDKSFVAQGVSVLKQYINGEISYEEYKQKLKMKNNQPKEEEAKISPNNSQSNKKSVMNLANVAEIFIKDNNKNNDLNLNYDEPLNKSLNNINQDSKMNETKNEINAQKRNSNEKELLSNNENIFGMIKMYNKSKKKDMNVLDFRSKEDDMSFQEQDQSGDKSNEIVEHEFIIKRNKTDSLFSQKLLDINEEYKNKNYEKKNSDSFYLEEKHYFPDINNLGPGLIKVINYNTRKAKEKRENKKANLLEFIKKSYDDQEINNEKKLMQLKNTIAFSKNMNNNKANNSYNNINDIFSNTLSFSFRKKNIKNMFKKELNLKKTIYNRNAQNSFIGSLKEGKNSNSLISLEKMNLDNIFMRKQDADNVRSNYKKLIPINLKESRSTSNIKKRKINDYSLLNKEDKQLGKLVNKIKDIFPYEDKISLFETSNIENLNKNVFSLKKLFYKK